MRNEVDSDSESEKENDASTMRRKPGSTLDVPVVSYLEIPLSVQTVISRIEKAQLIRAKEEINMQLTDILNNVQRIITRYTPDDLTSLTERRKSLIEYKRKRRTEVLEKVSSYSKGIEVREKTLTHILAWLEEWTQIPMVILGRNAISLFCVVFILPESRSTLWKSWKDRVVKRPATAHALKPDQMISDQFATNTKVLEIQDMLQELIGTTMFNKLENSAIKYISSTIVNLSKALCILSDNLKAAIDFPVGSIYENETREAEKECSQKIIYSLSEQNEMLQQRLKDIEEKFEQLIKSKAIIGQQLYTSLSTSSTLKVLSEQSSMTKADDIEDTVDSILSKEFENILDESQRKGTKGTGKKWEAALSHTAQAEATPELSEQPDGDTTGDDISLKKGDDHQKDETDYHESQRRRYSHEASEINLIDGKGEQKVSEDKLRQRFELEALEKKKKERKPFSQGKSKPSVETKSKHFSSTETNSQGDRSGTRSTGEQFRKVRPEQELEKGPISSEIKSYSSSESVGKEIKSKMSRSTEAIQFKSDFTSEPQKVEKKGKKHQILPGRTTSKEGIIEEKELLSFIKQTQAQLLVKSRSKVKMAKEDLGSPDGKSEQDNLELFQKAILAFLKEKIDNIGKSFRTESMLKEEKLLKKEEVEKLGIIKAKTEEYFQKVAETVTKILRKYKNIKTKGEVEEKSLKQKKIVSFMPDFQKSKPEISLILENESSDPIINNLIQMILTELERDVPTILEGEDYKEKEKKKQKEYLPEDQEKISSMRELQKPKQEEEVGKERKKQRTQKRIEQDGKENQRKGDKEVQQQSKQQQSEAWKKTMKERMVPLEKKSEEMMGQIQDLVITGQKDKKQGRGTEDFKRQRQFKEKDKTEKKKSVEPTEMAIQRPVTYSRRRRTLKHESQLYEEQKIQKNLETVESLPAGQSPIPVTPPTSTRSSLTSTLPASEESLTEYITLSPEQAQALGITLTPEQAQAQGITLTSEQAQALGITLTQEQAQIQGIILTPKRAQAQGTTLTSQQAHTQGITLTPDQAQALGITLSPQQAQDKGITLTPQQAQAKGITLTPQQAQELGITLSPQQAQALRTTLTPQQAQARGITLTTEQEQALGITIIPEHAQDKGITLTPQQAQALGITIAPEQAQAQRITLTPEQAQILGITLTPELTQAKGITLTPEWAQALGITLTTEQAQVKRITFTPEQARTLGITLVPEQTQAKGITLDPEQVQAKGITLTSEQAQVLGITLTPHQAQALGITLIPEQAQAKGITLTPEQAQGQAQGIPLTPQQAQEMGITHTLEQAQPLGITTAPEKGQDEGITLTPQQAQELGITLTPEQSQARGITLTPEQAQVLGITITPEYAQAKGITLTPQQVQAQGTTLTPQQAQTLGITLSPELIQAKEITLTPEQAQVLGITLTTEQAQAKGITLTPEQAQAKEITLTPEQAQTLGITLSPEHAQAKGLTLTPEQAQALGFTLTPEQAQAKGITLTPEQAQAKEMTLTPEQAQKLGITLAPEEVQALGITITPEQAQALGITLTPQQAQALGITITPEQAQAKGITLTPEHAKVLGFTLTPEQVQAKGITLTSEQAQELGITITPEQAQAKGITLTPEHAKVLGFTLTPEQVQAKGITLTPQQPQALGITIAPEQAQAQGITLTPQQVQTLGITLTPEQAQALGITLTPEQAQALGITLTPEQAQSKRITLTPEQAQALGITLTPQQAQAQRITLTPEQAQAQGITLTPQQAQAQGITLTPQQAQAQGITLTPQQAQAQGITLTPQQAQTLGITLTPQEAQVQGITLTPQQAQAQGITLTPQQAQAKGITLTPQQGITLSPQQAQDLGFTLTPEEAQAQGVTLTPQQAQDLGFTPTPQQPLAQRITLTPQQAPDLGIRLTPQKTQDLGITLTPQQAQAQRVPLTPQQAQDLGISFNLQQAHAQAVTLSPQSAQVFGATLTPEQVQALLPPLPSGQAVGISHTPKIAQALEVPLTEEQARKLRVSITPEKFQGASNIISLEQFHALRVTPSFQQAQALGTPLTLEKLSTLAPSTLRPFHELKTSFPTKQSIPSRLSPSPGSPRKGQGMHIPSGPGKLLAPQIFPTSRQILVGKGQFIPAQSVAPEISPNLGQLPISWVPPIPGQPLEQEALSSRQFFISRGLLTPQPPLILQTPVTPRQPLISRFPSTFGQIPKLWDPLSPGKPLVPEASSIPRELQESGPSFLEQPQALRPSATPEPSPYLQTSSLFGQQLAPWIIPRQVSPLSVPSTPRHPSTFWPPIAPEKPQGVLSSSVAQKRSAIISSLKSKPALVHPSAPDSKVSQAPFTTKKAQISEVSDTSEETKMLQDTSAMGPFETFQSHLTNYRIPILQTPHIDGQALPPLMKPQMSLPSLITQLPKISQILPAQWDQKSRFPPIDKPWILPSVLGIKKPKVTEPPSSPQELEEKRYFVDVEAQRKNLILLNQATKTSGLPSQQHTTARNLIIETLHMNNIRLGYLFRKYIAYSLIQHARPKAWEMEGYKDGEALQEKYKLNLSLPIHLIIDKNQIPTSTEFSQQPFLELLFEEEKKSDAFKKFRQEDWMKAMWHADLSTSSYPITEKMSIHSLWAQLGGYPDIPRLLQLDIQSTFRKSLASIQSQ
nr:protein FAM186A [Ictidomys tridecemlineatus]